MRHATDTAETICFGAQRPSTAIASTGLVTAQKLHQDFTVARIVHYGVGRVYLEMTIGMINLNPFFSMFCWGAFSLLLKGL